MLAVAILGLGGLLAWLLVRHASPGDYGARSRGLLLFSGAVLLSGVILIMATARLWFRHLWPNRRKYGEPPRPERNRRVEHQRHKPPRHRALR